MDFETEVRTPSATDMVRIQEAIALLRQLQGEAEMKKLELDRVLGQIARVSEVEIPAIFDELGIQDMRLIDGRRVTIKSDFRPSISEDNREEVFLWMRTHNHAELIKNELKVVFGKGEDSQAAVLLERLALEGLAVDFKTFVHPATLAAFVREQTAKGEAIPDGINQNPYRKTIIK